MLRLKLIHVHKNGPRFYQTTTKHNKARPLSLCIFLGIYCTLVTVHCEWHLKVCIRDQSHKSHYTPLTMHHYHSEQKNAHLCSEWCIVGQVHCGIHGIGLLRTLISERQLNVIPTQIYGYNSCSCWSYPKHPRHLAKYISHFSNDTCPSPHPLLLTWINLNPNMDK